MNQQDHIHKNRFHIWISVSDFIVTSSHSFSHSLSIYRRSNLRYISQAKNYLRRHCEKWIKHESNRRYVYSLFFDNDFANGKSSAWRLWGRQPAAVAMILALAFQLLHPLRLKPDESPSVWKKYVCRLPSVCRWPGPCCAPGRSSELWNFNGPRVS